MIEADSTTPTETMVRYVNVIHTHWHAIKKTQIQNGVAKCELHNGVVIRAETPERLEELLEDLTK